MESLFDTLMRRPPEPTREFTCAVCKVALRGATVTLDERGRATCHACTGREVER